MLDSARLTEAVRRHPAALRPDGITPDRVASIRAEYDALGREPDALTPVQLAALTRIMELVEGAGALMRNHDHPYSIGTLCVLRCMYVLTGSGQDADMQDVDDLLRDRYGMSKDERDEAFRTATREGAIERGPDKGIH